MGHDDDDVVMDDDSSFLVYKLLWHFQMEN